MKQNHILIWNVVAVLLLMYGCEKEPPPKPVSAGFTYQNTGIDRTYIFTSDVNVLDAVNLHVWDFGDGTSESGSSLTTHTYAQHGSYTVKHKVYSVEGFDMVVKTINTN